MVLSKQNSSSSSRYFLQLLSVVESFEIACDDLCDLCGLPFIESYCVRKQTIEVVDGLHED